MLQFILEESEEIVKFQKPKKPFIYLKFFEIVYLECGMRSMERGLHSFLK